VSIICSFWYLMGDSNPIQREKVRQEFKIEEGIYILKRKKKIKTLLFQRQINTFILLKRGEK
jgi:hypothetical protein